MTSTTEMDGVSQAKNLTGPVVTVLAAALTISASAWALEIQQHLAWSLYPELRRRSTRHSWITAAGTAFYPALSRKRILLTL